MKGPTVPKVVALYVGVTISGDNGDRSDCLEKSTIKHVLTRKHCGRTPRIYNTPSWEVQVVGCVEDSLTHRGAYCWKVREFCKRRKGVRSANIEIVEKAISTLTLEQTGHWGIGGDFRQMLTLVPRVLILSVMLIRSDQFSKELCVGSRAPG